MQRRDFFGIIAAPLLRRFGPPVPMAKTLGVEVFNGSTWTQVAPIRGTSNEIFVHDNSSRISKEAADQMLRLAGSFGKAARAHQEKSIIKLNGPVEWS